MTQYPPAAAAARSRGDVLLVLAAGGAEVDVRVDERRREYEALPARGSRLERS